MLLETLEVSEWSVGQLDAYVGGLSRPSKMPGYSFSIPAAECITGTPLRDIEGSTCSGCYAYERGHYAFKGTKAAQYRRLACLDKPLWAYAMAELLNRRAKRHPHFRWHDSGDLQSLEHLQKIVLVCELTPTIMHWIPTREYRIVAEFDKAGGIIPPNLNVRMSAHMIGGHVPTFSRFTNLVTVSSVSTAPNTYPNAYECPARFQDNECKDCRACWSLDVPHVDYHAH